MPIRLPRAPTPARRPPQAEDDLADRINVALTVREDAAGHLFIGEETASVAFGAMTRSLDGRALAVIEVGDPADRLRSRAT